MSFVEFGNFLQFREMIMGPQPSTTIYEGTLTLVPGNEIPNWFNHQSVGSSISFWIGPGFPKFALCLVFGTKNGDDYYDVMSTFPSMVENKIVQHKLISV
jgi:hypothetical protein